MKTNHQRGFIAPAHRYKGGTGFKARGQVADRSFSAWVGWNFTDGNRGMAKAIRGAKKFVRSRMRFHDDAATRALAAEHMAGATGEDSSDAV